MSKKNKSNAEVEVWKKYKSVRLTKAVREIILDNGVKSSGIRDRTLAKLKEIQEFVSELYLINAGGVENVEKHLDFIKQMENLTIEARPYGFSHLISPNSAKISRFRVHCKQLPVNKELGTYIKTFSDSIVTSNYYSPENLSDIYFTLVGNVIGYPGRTAFPKVKMDEYIDLDKRPNSETFIKRLLKHNDEITALYEEYKDIRQSFQTILNNSGSTKRLLQQMPEALKLIPDYILEGMSPPQLPALLIADTTKKLNL